MLRMSSVLIILGLHVVYSSQAQQEPLVAIDNLAEHSAETEENILFSLRHVVHHGTHKFPSLHKQFDISDSESTLWIEEETGILKEILRPLVASSKDTKINRIHESKSSTINSFMDTGFWPSDTTPAWNLDTVMGPNITEKDTILTLAHMMANAYEPEPHTGAWKDVDGSFSNDTLGFGWEEDGIRGYIYNNKDSSIVVITIKGGSLAIWDGGGTVKNDKENVNLLFSCCCGQGSYFYRKVCDCTSRANTCNIDCVSDCLRSKDRYYTAARELYTNVEALYPNAQIWMAGHSLGGAMSALIGLTYGVPVVTFETPPDALAASRLGLPIPPGSPSRNRLDTGVYQFGVTSDPIYTGTCHGPAASCSYAGYAFESSCHSGNKCVYDVVNDLGWRSSISTHGIAGIIKDVIMKYDSVPACVEAPECDECALWKKEHGPYTTTALPTSSSTKARTRTETCETPGWWGCMDKTSSATSTLRTSTSVTQTCETPGWFGCHDKTSLTSSTSSRDVKVTAAAK